MMALALPLSYTRLARGSAVAGGLGLTLSVSPFMLVALMVVVERFWAAMAQIVDDHQGTVNEFVGDGLMALFGTPQPLAPEVPARSAVEAAQAMQAKLPDLNGHWRKLGLGTPLQLRIGSNTGTVSVGRYGSQARMTYTAIGMQSNIAARLQSQCKPGEILLSDATWQLVHDAIDCSPRGEVECKGIHYQVPVYSPKGPPTAE